jgi:hypothetical protein
MSPRDRDRRRLTGRNIGIASAGAGLLIVSIAALISNIGSGSDTPGAGAGVIRLDLIAARDIGSLPSRDTWCTTVPADHCWPLQQSSGDATDYGSPGGWHLVQQGSPRVGVVTSVPVRDSSGWVDIATEKASWYDLTAGRYHLKTGVSHSATRLSITAIINPKDHTSEQWAVDYGFTTGGGALLDIAVNGRVFLFVAGTVATKSIQATEEINDSAWHCVTVVADATDSTIYIDGAQGSVVAPMAYYGALSASSESISLGARSNGTLQTCALARVHAAHRAITLAEHQALCGDLWQAPAGGAADNKPLAADATWTQTAGAGCYPTGATSAVCVPGGMMPYVVDSTGAGWPVQQAVTNELLYSTAVDCTNWTCIGSASATPGAVAPDGSATASLLAVAVGANHVEQDIVAGFTASASPLHLGMWFRCLTGTIHPHGSDDGTRGDWDIDCSCVGGQWTYLDADHPCVTVNTPFNADSSGNSGLHFDGGGLVSGTLWAPTLTEQRAWSRVVIPTAASAVTMGSPIWAINNTSTNYYRAGDTVLQSLTEYSGTCFAVPGSDILLSGSPTCSGTWYGLQVRK